MITLESIVEHLGENGMLAIGAMLIGVVFGFMAQRSRFCLRSAVIEFARSHLGGKLTVWLFAFATAVGVTQALAWFGWFDASHARQIAARGSLSGAAVDGALSGVGLIMARACSSRLLVLAALGNLRSLLGPGMRRDIAGAMLMGFGGMLAGGCAVAAGLSGAAVFTAASWVTLCAMWAAADITDRLMDPRHIDMPDQAMPGASRSQASSGNFA